MNNNSKFVSPSPTSTNARHRSNFVDLTTSSISPFTLPSYTAPICDRSDVTNDEIINILSSRSKTKERAFNCSKQRLKDAIAPIIKDQLNIRSILQKIDQDSALTDQATNLTSSFDIELPYQGTTKQKKPKLYALAQVNALNVPELASKCVALFTLMEQASKNTLHFRRSYDSLFSSLYNLINEAISHATELKLEISEPSKVLRGLKPKDIDRRFCKGGGFLPPDGYQSCIFCTHHCVDEVPENKDVVKNNMAKDTQHAKLKKEWEDWKSGKSSVQPKGKLGKIITKAPTAPKKEKKILQCHCYQMTCAREGSNCGNQCVFKCIHPITNKKYEWRNINGIKQCACPVCQCNCRKAYAIDDMTTIMTELTKRQSGVGNADIDGEEKARKDQQIAINFIHKALKYGETQRNFHEKEVVDKMLGSGELFFSIPLVNIFINFMSTHLVLQSSNQDKLPSRPIRKKNIFLISKPMQQPELSILDFLIFRCHLSTNYKKS